MATPSIERLTISMPTEMAQLLKDAVAGGDYTTTSEVVREALHDWKTKRALQLHGFAALKADIHQGLADLEAGKTSAFDQSQIIERGRKLLASR